MLNVWPGCFANRFSIRNVSNGCHLLVLGVRFFMCSTSDLAATPPKIGGPLPCGALFFPDVSLFNSKSFSISVVSNAGLSPANITLLAWVNSLTTTVSQRVSAYDTDCLQPITTRPREKLASTLRTCGIMHNMLCATLERLVYFESLYSCWRHQSVISGIESVLQISIGWEW